jgi:hypothetical protein
MSEQFKFAGVEHGGRSLHMQRRLHRTKRGHVRCMRDREIQEHAWKFDMHRLRRWQILCGRGRKCVHGMSCECQFAYFKHGRD